MTQPNQSGGESDTPRTDAEFNRMRHEGYDRDDLVSLDFARQLERENAELRRELEKRTAQYDEVAAKARELCGALNPSARSAERA